MQRKLIWIKEKSSWGCTECVWVFSATHVRLEGSMADMGRQFEDQLQQEFHQHSCADHPKASPEKVR